MDPCVLDSLSVGDMGMNGFQQIYSMLLAKQLDELKNKMDIQGQLNQALDELIK